jgi:predicted patatin/cPLA2 family phospholipase
MPIKIGVVASGGGNYCGATGGALRALYEVHGIEEPHVMVMVSGGTQPALCYLARRLDDMLEWPRLFSDRKYLCLWRFWRIMDIDYLVDSVLTPQFPGLYAEVSRRSTKVFIAATEQRTGKTRWLTNRHLHHGGKLKKATSAVPGIYAKAVEIDGERLLDGCFSITLAECVQKAFDEGADKVIVIDTEGGPLSRAAALALRILSFRQGRDVRTIVKRFGRRQDTQVTASDSVIVCRPENFPNRHVLDTNPVRTAEGMQRGYDTMAAIEITWGA